MADAGGGLRSRGRSEVHHAIPADARLGRRRALRGHRGGRARTARIHLAGQPDALGHHGPLATVHSGQWRRPPSPGPQRFHRPRRLPADPDVPQRLAHHAAQEARYPVEPRLNAAACAAAQSANVRGCLPVNSRTVVVTEESSNSPSTKNRKNASTNRSGVVRLISALASSLDSAANRRSLPSTPASTRTRSAGRIASGPVISYALPRCPFRVSATATH